MSLISYRVATSLIGIEITGINLAIIDSPRGFTEIQSVLDQHHLLIIKNQELSKEQLVKISYFFGEPVQSLVSTYKLEQHPLISIISNKRNDDGKKIGIMAPEFVFHADSYFTKNPNKYTLLYSLKAPKQEGETLFVNMCHAYNTLDESVKTLIADKKISYKNVFINQPPVVHPLVRVHPVTQKKSLFVNIHRALGVENLTEPEGLQLLQYLYSHAIKKETIYKHKWDNGDLLIWNNSTTMHCATPILDTEERMLYRVFTKGDFPVS